MSAPREVQAGLWALAVAALLMVGALMFVLPELRR